MSTQMGALSSHVLPLKNRRVKAKPDTDVSTRMKTTDL